MIFTIFIYLKLIIKTIYYYSSRFEILSLVKLFIFLTIFLLNLFINQFFLIIDHIFFNYKKTLVKNPLFIIGFPRSGTTFLHKMILYDHQFTTPKLWEFIFAPSIIQKYIYSIIAQLFKKLNFIKSVNSLFRPLTHSLDNIHEINLNNPEEDYLFLLPYGGCFLLTLIFPINEIWNLYNFDKNFTSIQKKRLLSKYKKLIQRHLYFHGEDKIYLSKNPHFTCFTESLKTIFPDCNMIGCYRDPKQSLPSLLSSMEPGYILMSRTIQNDLRHFISMYKVYFNSLKKNHIQNNSFLLVHMKETKYNLDRVILKIYKNFNYKTNNHFFNLIENQANKSKDFKSKNKYTLEYFSIEKLNFEEEYKEYYSFIKHH